MALPPSIAQLFMSTVAGIQTADAIARFFQGTLHGHENVPRLGGALIVSNHAFLGIDSVVLASVFVLRTGRLPRFLGDKNLWKIPGMPRVLDAVGAIPGAPDDAVELLKGGELVCVYPGGIDDSFKVSREAYKLQWKARAGFARVALRARAPIVPVAATGIDELFEIPRREGLLGRFLFGSPRYDVPLPRTFVPRRVPLDYHVLPPVEPSTEFLEAQAERDARDERDERSERDARDARDAHSERGEHDARDERNAHSERDANDENDAAEVERMRLATFEAIESVLAPYRERASQGAESKERA